MLSQRRAKMIKPWRRTRSQQGRSYRVFSVRTDTAISPRTDESHDFYVIESRDWVNIIPITSDERVVMVKQYRHGSREITLEIPGGIVDPGETSQGAAVRELLEETGYQTENCVQIGEVNPNPAIFSNRCFTFLAPKVKKAADPKPDQTEDIEVILVPLSDIPELIRQGKIDHAIVVAAFHFYFLGTQAR
jgi:ADP-ribose pyrophosphatase